MPHLVLEHSAELTHSHDLGALADALFDAACAHRLFAKAPGAVKVRTIACANGRSGVLPETYAHLTLRLLSGRSPEDKAALAEDFLQILDRHLPDIGSLSVEPVEIDTRTYAKRAL